MNITSTQITTARLSETRKVAEDLETGFLAQMLKSAGLAGRESFGGGVGETQFTSFMREEQARAIVRSGGIGLTEMFIRQMGQLDGA